MARRALVPVVVVVALAAAPGAVGKAPPGGLDVCGAGNVCVHLSDGDSEQVWIRVNDSGGPAQAAPFYVVRWDGPGYAPEEAYYVPSARVMRFVYQANPQAGAFWREVEPAGAALLARALRGIPPLQPPAPTSATVGGRAVRDPASYLRLFKGTHVWTWPATPWLRVTVAAADRSPWTDGLAEIVLARTPGYVSVDGWVYRIPKTVARRALRGLSLAGR